jgi:uncharacterized protein YoxC
VTNTNPETSGPDLSETRNTELTALSQGGGKTASRKRGLGRRLFRIVLLLVTVGAIGAGAYFGWPIIRDEYIRPVAANTDDLAEVRRQLDQAVGRVNGLEAQLAAVQASVNALSGEESDDATQLGQIATAVADLGQRLDDLDAVANDLATRADQSESNLEREVDLLRAMGLLSRARLFLYQANYGMAIQDLRAARVILGSLQQSSADATIDATLFRLDLALAALPDRPVAASDDLDIAWETIVGELPAPSPTPAPTTPTTSTTSTTSPAGP